MKKDSIIFKREECPVERFSVTFEIAADADLDEMDEAYKRFLMAIGYSAQTLEERDA